MTHPPAGPSTPPPPSGPKALTVPDLLAEADAVLSQTPARRDRFSAAVGADAIARTGGSGPFFTLPLTPPVPRFAEGEDRLVGRVGPLDEAEAEAMARLINAATTSSALPYRCPCLDCTERRIAAN